MQGGFVLGFGWDHLRRYVEWSAVITWYKD